MDSPFYKEIQNYAHAVWKLMNDHFERDFIFNVLDKFEDDMPKVVKLIFQIILEDHKKVCIILIFGCYNVNIERLGGEST